MKQIILDGDVSNYVIDVDGNVFGKRGILTPIIWSQGRYLMYSFNHKGKKVRRLAHRLVAEYCLTNNPTNLEDYHVNHINGNKFDNRPVNLEWTTIEENVDHEFRTGLCNGKPYRKLDVYSNGQLVASFPSINQCAKQLGLNSGNIHSALKNGHLVKGYNIVEV